MDNRPSHLPRFLLLTALGALLSLFYLLSIPADPKNTLFLGLSARRLFLVGILLIPLIASLALRHARPSVAARLEALLFSPFLARFTPALCLTLLLLLILSWLPDAADLAAYAERLRPLLLWLFLLNLQTLYFQAAYGDASLRALLLARPLRTRLTYWRRHPVTAEILASVLAFAWPFVYMWPYVISWKNQHVSVGNDFIPWYYYYKVYLLDALSNGWLPLWSPAEGAGYPFYANPEVQLLYPFNLPLTWYYHWSGFYTVLDYQRFAVFGIAIFSLGLYRWLRSLNFSRSQALGAALIMGVSLKIVENLRWPNAIHSAAWYPWILLALTQIFKNARLRRLLGYSLLLFFSLFCLFTGGYPYYIYYPLLLFGPYGIFFLIPAARRTLFALEHIHLKRSLPAIFLPALLAGGLCAPYLYQVNNTLMQTYNRSGGNFEFSTANVFSLQDSLGALLFPPAAQTEGVYFFGIAALLVIFIYLFDRRSAAPYTAPWVKALFISWIVLISYISYGKESYLFVLLWKHIPFFSRLRYWGRLGIILVPIFAWLLAIAWRHLEARLSQPGAPLRRPLTALIIAFAAILGCQVYISQANLFDFYWKSHFLHRLAAFLRMLAARAGIVFTTRVDALSNVYVALYVILTVLSFLALLILVQRRRSPGRLALSALVLLSTLNTWITAPWLWVQGILQENPRGYLNAEQVITTGWDTPRNDTGYISLTPTFHTGYKGTTWYFVRYVEFRDRTESEKEATRQLLGIQDGQRLYFSQSLQYTTIAAFLDDAARQSFTAEKIDYTSDRLLVKVVVPQDGYLSFIDNWEAAWRARVDQRPVPIELLFGTFKSVPLTAGEHLVEFSYCPDFFWRWSSACPPP